MDLESRLNNLEILLKSQSDYFNNKIQELENYNHEMEQILTNIINYNIFDCDKNNEYYKSLLELYLLRADNLNYLDDDVIYYVFNYNNFRYDKNEYQELLTKKILAYPDIVNRLNFDKLFNSFTVDTFEYFCELFTNICIPKFDVNKICTKFIEDKNFCGYTKIFKYFLTKYYNDINIKDMLIKIINKNDDVQKINFVSDDKRYSCSTKYNYCNIIIELLNEKHEHNIKIGIKEFKELNYCRNYCHINKPICSKIKILNNFFVNDLCDDGIKNYMNYSFLGKIIICDDIECFNLVLDKFCNYTYLNFYKQIFQIACEYNRIEFAKLLIRYIPDIPYKQIEFNEYEKMDDEFKQWIQDDCPVNRSRIKSSRSIILE